MPENTSDAYPVGLPSTDQGSFAGSSTPSGPPNALGWQQQQFDRSDGDSTTQGTHGISGHRGLFQASSGEENRQLPSWGSEDGCPPPGHDSVTTTAQREDQRSTSAGLSAAMGCNHALSSGSEAPVLEHLAPRSPAAFALELPQAAPPGNSAASTDSKGLKSSRDGTKTRSSAGQSRKRRSSADWSQLARSGLESKGQRRSTISNTDRQASEIRGEESKAERQAKIKKKKEEAASRKADKQAESEMKKATAALQRADKQAERERKKSVAALQRAVRQAESERKKKAASRKAEMEVAESLYEQEEEEREEAQQTMMAEKRELEWCLTLASGYLEHMYGLDTSRQESNKGSEDGGPMAPDELVQLLAEEIYESQKSIQAKIDKNDLETALYMQQEHKEAKLNKAASCHD